METIRFKDYLKDYLEDNNISNKEFAKRINVSPKHLIQILNGTMDLSSRVIYNIALVTNIPAHYICNIESNYELENNIKKYLLKEDTSLTSYLNNYNYRDLIKDDEIPFIQKDNQIEVAKDILKFLRVPSPEKIYEMDEGILYKSKNDKPELKALWLEMCYKETLKQEVGLYSKDNLNDIIEFIYNEAKENRFDEKRLITYFNKKGIYLVIKNDLPGAKIRGAFKVLKDKPAIYITYRHKRLADIYFALLHELAHCKSDFNSAKKASLISSIADKDTITLDSKADIQAYSWMVPNEYYEKVKKGEIDYHQDNTYPKAFIIYRLAHDNPDLYKSSYYQRYNPILNIQRN